MVASQDLKILRERYVSSLLLGDASKAKQAVIDAQSRGLGVQAIYVDILDYSQSVIGEMWHKGQINIGIEHLATVITLEIMSDLRLKASSHRKSNGFRAVITPVEGDTHIVGSRMLSDFLIIDGWEVDFMGGPTPAEDLDLSPALTACSSEEACTVASPSVRGIGTTPPAHTASSCAPVILGTRVITRCEADRA